jgi:hypothetical protein
MRIFQGFLVMVVTALLWLLPVSEAIYNFRTDIREDAFTIVTGVGETTAAVVLYRAVYNDDEGTVSLLSDLATDTPALDSYVPATHVVNISGLTASSSRELTVAYDIDALNTHPAVGILMDILPVLWVLVLIAFPVVALVVIIRGRF